jgi:hypothetical protein
VVALVVAAVVAWPYVQRYTSSAPPPRSYNKVQLESAHARDYPRRRAQWRQQPGDAVHGAVLRSRRYRDRC